MTWLILFFALFVIVLEAVGEGLLKRFSALDFIFDLWFQWVIAIFLFGMWFIPVYLLTTIPVIKLILGFIFVRFLIFDITWNLARGVKWNYYGTTKLYDRIMTKLAGFGWWIKFCLGVVGITFLLGIQEYIDRL